MTSATSKPTRTHYQVLGVPPAASPVEVRDAAMRLVTQNHPDRVGAVGETKIREINTAYSVLRLPDTRREYDKYLHTLLNPCSQCKGEGIVYQQRGFTQRVARTCKLCRGTGFDDL